MDSDFLIQPVQQSFKHVIIKSANGTFIDLENINYNSVVNSLTMDLRGRNTADIKVDFNCNLNYELNMYNSLELVFSLYRQDEIRNSEQLLNSWPYKLVLNERLQEGEPSNNIIIEKNETFSLSYQDYTVLPGIYNYIVKAEINYFNIEATHIQSSTLSIIAQ